MNTQQKSIEAFTNIREKHFSNSSKIKHFTLTNRTGDIAQSLKQSVAIYDDIIIDTRGADTTESTKAMLFADLLIIPTTPSQLDYDVLVAMLERIKAIKDINEDLRVCVVMNKLATNPFLYKEINDFSQAIHKANAEFGSEDFVLLQSGLYERIAYKRAISEGLGITEYSDEKAKEEFNGFVEEALSVLNKALA